MVRRNGKSVTVVVPAFRSAETLRELVERIHRTLHDQRHEIVVVDDASGDSTWETVRSIAVFDSGVRAVRLGRNAGQHGALLAGIRHAQFEVIVTIDDDLQNPPEEIPALLEALVDGVDVVYGIPISIAQSRWRRIVARVSRWFISKTLGAPEAAEFSSFRTFHTRLRDGFRDELGPSVSIDALLTWSTSRFASVPVAHHRRAIGTSHYGFLKLLRFAFDTATGYSTLPLQIASILGVATSLFGLVVLGLVVVQAIFSGDSVPGFPFLASTIAIFSGVQLITLGIMGEYLARIHFRVMRKPTYVIAELIEGDSGS